VLISLITEIAVGFAARALLPAAVSLISLVSDFANRIVARALLPAAVSLISEIAGGFAAIGGVKVGGISEVSDPTASIPEGTHTQLSILVYLLILLLY
jgi:hypothetical protein